MRSLVSGIVFVFCTSIAVQAQDVDRGVSEFLGSWRNIEGQDRRISRIDIRPDYDNRVAVEVWGDCSGEECSYGTVTGRVFVNRGYDNPEDRAAILFKFSRPRVSGNVLVKFERGGVVVSNALLSFENGNDVYRVERFERDRNARYYGDEVGRRYRD